MSVVAVAIMISFHLKNDATPIELRAAIPFGLVFWLLAIACLGAGLGNYIKTVNRYSRRQALVQTGLATQIVSLDSAFAQRPVGMHWLTMVQVFGVVACAIVAACILFLSTNRSEQ